jgi:hypothetical protein
VLTPGGLPPALTDEQVARTRRQYASRHVSFRELAQDTGLSRERIRLIVRGYGYKHVGYAVPEYVTSKRHYGVKVRLARRRNQSAPSLIAAE